MLTEEPDSPGEGISALLVDRLRDVHARMVDAVLSGDRMRDVAAIAARRAGAAVAVIVPELGHELVEPSTDESERVLIELREHVAAQLAGEAAPLPPAVVREAPVKNGGVAIGSILLLAGGESTNPEETDAVLHLAAMAAMTDLALVESRQQLEDELRGSFLEELRAGVELEAAEVVRRGARLGCDLSQGAIILAGDPEPERAHRFMAAVKAQCPEAFVQRLAGRVYTVIPATGSDDARDRATAMASVLARRLRAHAPVGLSSFYPNPSELARAIREADLVVDVLGHAELEPDSLADGTYRLLLQLLASHPAQLRSYHEATIKPLASYDERYRTDLVGTLAAYLDHDCRLSATAEALFAHRHTISYRLERIRELTGLNPVRHEDREQLSLGLKIHRLTRPISP